MTSIDDSTKENSINNRTPTENYDTSPSDEFDIDLVPKLSDAGCFSYAAVCASELFSLYRNAEVDR